MTSPETPSVPLVITLFGPMQVLIEGRPLPHMRSRKALWLLALLTLRHHRPVEREWLAGAFWPDVDPVTLASDTFAALWEEGCSMTLDQAVAFALTISR